MKHFYLKVALLGLLLLFCILFGVSLATSGVEQIQGSLTLATANVQEAAVKPKEQAAVPSPSPAPAKADSGAKVKASAANAKESPVKDKEQADPVADHDNALNRVGNKLGDLLQITAHHGIKAFVSLFDGVLGKGEGKQS